MIKKFSLQAAADGNLAGTAFLMLINEFAIQTAKGRKAGAAWKAAQLAVERLGLSEDEKSRFDELTQEFLESDEFVETEFYRNGEKKKAIVTAYRFNKYPTVS